MDAENITISSPHLTAAINPHGAELMALSDEAGRSLMTDADPRWWTGHAPLLFPIVGRVTNGVYRLNGQKYPMPQHGFARTSDFALIEQSESHVIFRLEDSAESREIYPFAFRLDMRFAIAGDRLDMTATITNKGQKSDATPQNNHAKMPFSFGFHPALAWPLPYGGAADEHIIRFDKDEPASLRQIGDVPGHISPTPKPTPVKGNILPLSHDLFPVDALIWDRLESRALTYGVPGQRGLRIEFPNTPWLGLWQKPGAHYLCVEPWAGMADPEGFDDEIWYKPGMMWLSPQASRNFTMSIALTDTI